MDSSRRGFLRTMVGGVAAAAAVQSFPFRVYSFPQQPIVATLGEYNNYYSESSLDIKQAPLEYYSRGSIGLLKARIRFSTMDKLRPFPACTGSQINFFSYRTQGA